MNIQGGVMKAAILPELPEPSIKMPLELDRALARYRFQLETHPLRPLCERAALPRPVLEAFARAQFVDSTIWVAMLALIKGRVQAAGLREAVRKNILDEVGNDGVPHVTLCQRFVESVGVPSRYFDYREFSPASVYPVEVMMALAARADDATLGGWLLSQELLVPEVFGMFRVALAAIPEVDLEYPMKRSTPTTTPGGSSRGSRHCSTFQAT
jgi:pyrroloquinoline quinone (PQQ) biosynthesis protein C